MKAAIFDAKPYDIEWFDKANDGSFKLRYFESKLNPDTVQLANGFDAVVAFVNDNIDKSVIDALYGLGIHIVALRSAGYNNVDFKAAYDKVHVVRVPEYSPYAVAEHAMALLLTCNRKIHKAYIRVRENNFSINGLMGTDLHGKTAGVIGTGRIGRVFIDICKGFGMEVIAYDPYPLKDSDIRYVPLEEVFRSADFISLHCPLTPQTSHIINADSIRHMKEGVLIVNTSRGRLIDTEALIGGLLSSRIGGAALDVYEEEGDFFFEDLSNKILPDELLPRLFSFPNVVVTSHQAFFTKEAMEKIASVTLQNLREYESGAFMPNEICYFCTKNGTGKCLHKKGKNCF